MPEHVPTAGVSTGTVDSVVDLLIGAVLRGPVESSTRDLLVAAAGGDRSLLGVLILTGLALGDLARTGGRWRWGPDPTCPRARLAAVIADRAAGLPAGQLAALARLTGSWTEPHAALLAAVRNEPVGAHVPDVNLTRREYQVLVLLGEGLTAQAMARRLALSPRTIAKHQQRVYRKFGTADRLTTVLHAQRLGVLRGTGG
jgi:DNA-binding CsgD family transcriptional regulator